MVRSKVHALGRTGLMVQFLIQRAWGFVEHILNRFGLNQTRISAHGLSLWGYARNRMTVLECPSATSHNCTVLPLSSINILIASPSSLLDYHPTLHLRHKMTANELRMFPPSQPPLNAFFSSLFGPR